MRRRVNLMPHKDANATAEKPPVYVGIWLDHKKAEIVTIEGETMQSETIYSEAEPKIRSTGGRASGGWMARSIMSEKKVDNRRELELKRFYNQLIDKVQQADELLLMGPGVAKNEFHKEFLRRAPLSRKLADVFTDEKMTHRQLKAKVKKFFSTRHRAVWPMVAHY